MDVRLDCLVLWVFLAVQFDIIWYEKTEICLYKVYNKR